MTTIVTMMAVITMACTITPTIPTHAVTKSIHVFGTTEKLVMKFAVITPHSNHIQMPNPGKMNNNDKISIAIVYPAIPSPAFKPDVTNPERKPTIEKIAISISTTMINRPGMFHSTCILSFPVLNENNDDFVSLQYNSPSMILQSSLLAMIQT